MGIAQISIPKLNSNYCAGINHFWSKKPLKICKAAVQILKDFKSSTNELINENEQKTSTKETKSNSKRKI